MLPKRIKGKTAYSSVYLDNERIEWRAQGEKKVEWHVQNEQFGATETELD